MEDNKLINAKELLEKAKFSQHKEAYRTLDRKTNFRIGIGVRLTSTNIPSFFIEILIYLCPTSQKTDLDIMQKTVTCLKNLQARKYSLTCQDGNCISCEKTMSIKNIAEEYKKVKTLVNAIFK
jgi:hypothetical protein